jgi:hypothetical protein
VTGLAKRGAPYPRTSVVTIMNKMLLSFVLAASFGLAFAHSGGTDSKGCHHDTRTGTYHCH